LERAPPVAPHATVKTKFVYPAPKVAQISWDPETNSITPDTKLPGWVFNTKLVAKPDQLIKRRGKAGLLALNKTWEEARPWIADRAGKPQKVGFALRLCNLVGWDTIDECYHYASPIDVIPIDSHLSIDRVVCHGSASR
jgi:succinyl-CoA synthetase beta subunit